MSLVETVDLSETGWIVDPQYPLTLNLDRNIHLDFLPELSSQTRYEIFTHPSYDNVTNYQNLEYVGDAILQAASTIFLERKLPMLKKKDRYQIRCLMVGRTTLSQFSFALGLHPLVRTGARGLPPVQRVLEDVLEAIIGGIERDLRYSRAMEWCLRFLEAAWKGNETYFLREKEKLVHPSSNPTPPAKVNAAYLDSLPRSFTPLALRSVPLDFEHEVGIPSEEGCLPCGSESKKRKVE